MDLLSILAGLTALLISLVILYAAYMSRHFLIFKQLGIPGPRPWPAVGSLPAIMREGVIGFQQRLYDEYKDEKVYGYHEPGKPSMVITDLDMLKDICVKDFNKFCNRRTLVNQGKPLSHTLTSLQDENWRHVRNTVSPTFSSGKLKRMSLHVEQSSRILLSNLRETCEQDKEIELLDVISCFAMDVIAGTGFGMKIDSLKDRNCQFAVFARKLIQVSGLTLAIAFLLPFMTKFMGKLGMGLLSKDSAEYFCNFIDEAMAGRRQETKSHKRNDFIQLMINAEKADQAQAPEANGNTDFGTNLRKGKGLTYDEIQGQGIVFILGGYDTLSRALSFTLFLLANNPECCQKLQEELDSVLGGRFPTNDTVQELVYLDMCINESIRMYPPGPVLNRVCTEDCVIQGVKIPKGMVVTFPVMSIHNDPRLWPEPEKFDPERFSAENSANRHTFAHIPFGHGPRHCIAMRLALLEMKIAIAAVLQEMTPVPCEKTVYPIKIAKNQPKAMDDLWVKMVKRNFP